jgi:hypothetical protein
VSPPNNSTATAIPAGTAPYIDAILAELPFADPTYRRDLDPKRVTKMVSEFDQRLVGVLDQTQRGHQEAWTPRRRNWSGRSRTAGGKADPYGVYDIAADAGWVSVDTDHDTAAFAVETIRRWWRSVGAQTYPHASRLLITADGGGSTATAPGCRRPNSLPWPPGPAWRSPCAACHRAPTVQPHLDELARKAR